MPERLLNNPQHWRDRDEEIRTLVELMRHSEPKRLCLRLPMNMLA